MTTRPESSSTRDKRVVLGYRGFKKFYPEWHRDSSMRGMFAEEMEELGKLSYWIMARRCAYLTAEEATVVLNSLCFGSIDYERDRDSRFWDTCRKITGFLELRFKLSKLDQIVTACCELSSGDEDPYYEMYLASSHSEEKVGTVRQAFLENAFGLGRKRADHLRGDAINLISDIRIPASEVEWFGANWKTVAPLWDALKAERTLTRARVDALLNKSEETPSSLLDGVL